MSSAVAGKFQTFYVRDYFATVNCVFFNGDNLGLLADPPWRDPEKSSGSWVRLGSPIVTKRGRLGEVEPALPDMRQRC
jgi:hypothetical protein